KLGPDGALYVADFYNRIIGHYEVPLTHPGRDRERGRIWRIVYRGPRPAARGGSPPPPPTPGGGARRGASAAERPQGGSGAPDDKGKGTPAPRADWTRASVEELVKDLGHPNLTVRTKATNQLVERGGKAGVEAVRAALAGGGTED